MRKGEKRSKLLKKDLGFRKMPVGERRGGGRNLVAVSRRTQRVIDLERAGNSHTHRVGSARSGTSLSSLLRGRSLVNTERGGTDGKRPTGSGDDAL